MKTHDTDKADDQRRDTRIHAQLPVSIDEEQGYTRDISAHGMFIVQEHPRQMGSHVEFWVQLNTSLGAIKMRGEGEVSRIEQSGDRVGIGVKLLKQFGMRLILENFEYLQEQALPPLH